MKVGFPVVSTTSSSPLKAQKSSPGTRAAPGVRKQREVSGFWAQDVRELHTHFTVTVHCLGGPGVQDVGPTLNPG